MNAFEIRRKNLRQLVKDWGGPLPLAMKLGYSNASFIVQMAGPNPSREISEKTARKIEEKLGLTAGWLDQAHTGKNPKVNEVAVAQIVRAVAAVLEDAQLDLKPANFGEIVALVYEHTNLTGAIDEDYIKRLVTLCKKR
jgi:hypothetical protein